jgi:hypothetical protein
MFEEVSALTCGWGCYGETTIMLFAKGSEQSSNGFLSDGDGWADCVAV